MNKVDKSKKPSLLQAESESISSIPGINRLLTKDCLPSIYLNYFRGCLPFI